MPDNRYKQAGVDIDAADRLIDRIGPLARATTRPEVLGGIGHFGAMWNVPAARYRDLVLVSGTDGCGTKVKVAQAAGKHDTIGIDLVAMCVNDVLCTGAEPFFFLDYFACGKLDVDVAERVIAGIADGCKQAGCALVGGETAEMPGVYGEGVYDLAGFAVGGVERADVLDGSRVAAGMAILGLPSSGLHSNGYSLARKVVADAGLGWSDRFPGDDRTVADVLIEPTRIYVKPMLDVLRHHHVAGICHITGGGFWENVPRVLPDHLAARLRKDSFVVPNLFRQLQRLGEISEYELFRTFNCGVGLMVLVPDSEADAVLARLQGHGEAACRIGEIVSRTSPHAGQVELL